MSNKKTDTTMTDNANDAANDAENQLPQTPKTEIEIAFDAMEMADAALIAATKHSRKIGADESVSDADYNAAIAEKQKCEIAAKTAKSVYEKLKKQTEHLTRQTAIIAQLQYLIDSDETEKQTDNYKTIFADIAEKLKKSVPLDIPMGTTGTQLQSQTDKTKTNVPLPQITNGNLSIREQIYVLFDQGYDIDAIVAMGQFTRKQCNDTRFHWLRKNNLVGVTK